MTCTDKLTRLVSGISLLLIMSVTSASAQLRLHFTSGLMENGIPTDTLYAVAIESATKKINLVFNDPSLIQPLNVKVLVSLYQNGKYSTLEETTIMLDSNLKSAILPYELKLSGDYRFRMFDEKNNIIAEEILTVTEARNPGETLLEPESGKNPVDSLDEPEIIFTTESLNQGGEANSEFLFRESKGNLIMYIDPFPIQGDMLVLDIWKKSGDTYSQFIRTAKITLIHENQRGFFPISFDEKGQYKIDVSSFNNVKITTGYVTIN